MFVDGFWCPFIDLHVCMVSKETVGTNGIQIIIQKQTSLIKQ